MDKTKKIIIGVAVFVVAFIVGFIIAKPLHNGEKDGGQNSNNQNSSLGTIASEDDLVNLVNKIYEGVDENLLPRLETTPIPVSENETVAMLTGLENGDDLEFVVISQPMMSAQAYSLVLAKVKSGVNANDIAKKMCVNVDTRRWICVEAEQVYATNSGDIVCMVMADKEQASGVFSSFKKLAGSVGSEHEKVVEQDELPPDMY